MLVQSGSFKRKTRSNSSYCKSVGRLTKKIRNGNKKGGMDASKVNIHGVVINVGPVTTVRARDPLKTWSMDTAYYTFFIGSLADVVVSPPVSSRTPSDFDSVYIHGEWDKKALEMLETKYNDPHRRPFEGHTIKFSPQTFVTLKVQHNPNVSAGDLVKICNINMRVLMKEDNGEERAFLGADSLIHLTKIPVSVMTNVLMNSNAFTCWLDEPDFSVMGENRPRIWSNDPKTNHKCFFVGPRSYYDSENGMFSLDLMRAGSSFETIHYPPDDMTYDFIDPSVNQITYELIKDKADDDIHLNLFYAGRQVHQGNEQKFILNIVMYNDSEIKSKRKGHEGELVWIETELYKFSIDDVNIWKSLMPVYINLMDIVFICRPNDKKTISLKGDLDAASFDNGSGNTNALKQITDGDNRSDRFGMTAPATVGRSRRKSSKKEDKQPDVPRVEESVEDTSGPIENVDFLWSYTVSMMNVDSRSFWLQYGCFVPRNIAKALTLLIEPHESRMVPKQNARKEDVDKKVFDRKKAKITKIARDTDIANITYNTPGFEDLFDTSKPSGKAVKNFICVIPWPNVSEDYSEMLSTDSGPNIAKLQASFVIHAYGDLSENMNDLSDADVEFCKEALVAPHALDSEEWTRSPYAQWLEENGTLDITKSPPGIFAVWDKYEEMIQKAKTLEPLLRCEHETQRSQVEKYNAALEHLRKDYGEEQVTFQKIEQLDDQDDELSEPKSEIDSPDQ